MDWRLAAAASKRGLVVGEQPTHNAAEKRLSPYHPAALQTLDGMHKTQATERANPVQGGKMKAEQRVRIRKAGGDDRYSWALFIDGRMKWNGMDKREAQWRRKVEIRGLEERAEK